MKKSLLVVCKAIPFESGGAAGIIRNLFQNSTPAEEIVLIGRKPKTEVYYDILQLPYKTEILPLSAGEETFIKKITKLLYSLILGIKFRKKYNANVVLGIYRDESSFILSYLISILSGKPLFVYITDLYGENYENRSKKIFQKIVFHRAKKIFCLTEGMQQVYKDEYNLDTIVIPHCVNDIPKVKPRKYPNQPFKILFSGSIVHDRLDLLQNLVQLIGNKKEYKLRLLCPHDNDFLEANNLLADNVTNAFIYSNEEMLMELKKADLLYLPLTFKKPFSQRSFFQLKSCLGTKSFDYMQSGVPILVHSPKQYLTYQYFENRNMAFLLNSSNLEELKNKIEWIRNNYETAEELSKTALSCLNENDGKRIYKLLIKSIFHE